MNTVTFVHLPRHQALGAMPSTRAHVMDFRGLLAPRLRPNFGMTATYAMEVIVACPQAKPIRLQMNSQESRAHRSVAYLRPGVAMTLLDLIENYNF